MTFDQLSLFIQLQQSYLIVGLDSDITRIPKSLLTEPDPVFAFNKKIIEATKDFCVGYKINTAFYESRGLEGWKSLQKTAEILPETHFSIADAKRGDIGNTSKQYAKAFFEEMDFDSLTIAPYMGEDSVKPFLEFDDKWVILLALTSNKGSQDFQFAKDTETQSPLYERVMKTAMKWADEKQLMFVTGATHPQSFEHLRSISPNNFFLVPGVGAQGGDLKAVSQYGMNEHTGLLINSSRGIIFSYEKTGLDFAESAGRAAEDLQKQMAALL